MKNKFVGMVNFVLVDGVSHSRVHFFSNKRIHVLQDISGGVHSFHGHMRVGVAGSYKNRGGSKITFIIFIVNPVTDQTTGESYHTTIFIGVAAYKLQRLTSALRKAKEINIF